MALQDNLVSYYKLDGDATDSVASNNGTVNGATTTTSGKINGAYDFDGDNDYISIPAGVIAQAAFTLSFWEYSDGTTNSGYFASDSNDPANLFLRRGDSTPGDLNGMVGDSSSFQVTVTRQQWNFIVITNDNSGNYEVWVNGSKEISESGSNFAGLNNALYLGNRQDLGRDFDGKIDEVGIWDRVLTDEELGELYNNGDGLQYPFSTNTLINGVLSYYKFDSDTNDDVGSHNLTNNGATSSTSGKINGAYDYVTNDYMDTSNSTDYEESSFTVSLWCKPSAFPDHMTVIGMFYRPGAALNLYGWFLEWRSDGEFIFWEYNGGTSANLARTNPTKYTSTSTWYHVVLVQNGLGNNKIYVNGSLVHSDTGITMAYSTGNHDLKIGVKDDNGLTRYLSGSVDEVGYWNRVLTDPEITELYNSGSGLQYPFGEVLGLNMKINIGDSWKDVVAAKINIGDSWKEVTAIKQNIGDSWKVV